MANFFKKLQEREVKEKPAKPKEVCYVAIYSGYGYSIGINPFNVIDSIILGESNGMLWNAIAYEKEIEAEKNVLQSIKEMVTKGSYCGGIVTEKYRTTHKKEDLKPNAYWIFTIEGNAKDITNLLSREHPEFMRTGGPHEEFGRKILSAINNKSDHLIIASIVREREFKSRSITL